MAASVCLALLLSAALALSYASYLPQYTIRSISVQGAQNVSPNLVADYAESIVYNGSHNFFSRANSLLYPESIIERDIPLEFPRIASATISRSSPFSDAITITIVERQPAAIWCAASGETAGCYDADQNGFIFADATPDASSSGEYIFEGGISTSTNPIGQTFAPGHTPGIIAFLNELGQAGFTPIGADIQSGGEDFTVPLAQGFSVDASFGQDAGTLVDNLQLVLSSGALQGKQQELEYVDLRFGDRVYFKLKGQAEASTTPQ